MVSSEIRAEARKSLTGKWGKAALLALAYSVISYILSWVLNKIPVAGPIANVVITVPIAFGFLVGFIKLKRGEEVGYFDFFQNGFSNFKNLWAVVGNTLLKMILPIVVLIISIVIIFVGVGGSIFTSSHSVVSSSYKASAGGFGILGILGFILYTIAIIWVIVKGYSYVLTQYLLYDNPDMSAKDIVEKSEELMKGHKWAFFWLGLTFIGWSILACIPLGIGFLWLIPYIQVAQIVFYEDLAGTPSKVEDVEVKDDNNPISE